VRSAIAFGILAPRISRQLLLNLIIGLSAISTLGLLFMYDERSAILVYLFIGVTGTLAALGVLEIAARGCPTGMEGTTYALLTSIYNLANRPGPILGGYLYNKGVPLSTLVIISALFTALCWFLIPLLRLEED
jgi:predicted MFS family arabinose efflux permease